MAQIKLRHHLLVMATCLAMMLAPALYLALPTRMFQQWGCLIAEKPYLLKKSTDAASGRTKMLQKIVRMRSSAGFGCNGSGFTDNKATDRAAQARATAT